jgi:hypothetical protein
MTEPTNTDDPAQSAASVVRERVPAGYRQGVLAGIAVILGFSLSFLRYWGFEAEGHWTVISIIAAVVLILGIGLMIITLWRSLQVEDEYVDVYQTTLRWFLVSILVVFMSLVIAMVAYSGHLARWFPELHPASVSLRWDQASCQKILCLSGMTCFTGDGGSRQLPNQSADVSPPSEVSGVIAFIPVIRTTHCSLRRSRSPSACAPSSCRRAAARQWPRRRHPAGVLPWLPKPRSDPRSPPSACARETRARRVPHVG